VLGDGVTHSPCASELTHRIASVCVELGGFGAVWITATLVISSYHFARWNT